jgi:hypothetical protein
MKCKVHLGEIVEFEGTIAECHEIATGRYEEYLEQRDKDIALGKEVGELLQRDRTINGWTVEEACFKFFCSLIGRKFLKLDPNTIIKAVVRDDKSGVDYYIAGIPVDIKQQVLSMADMRYSYQRDYVNFSKSSFLSRIDKEKFRIIIIANIVEEENLLYIFGYIDSQIFAHHTLKESPTNQRTSRGADVLYCEMVDLHPDLLSAIWNSHNLYAHEHRSILIEKFKVINS